MLPAMVLACHVSSLGDLLSPRGKSPPKLKFADVPEYVREELGMTALTLSTDLLTGSTPERLVAFRDRADKASCACLMLQESTPQAFGSTDPDEVQGAIDRTKRVIQAAHLLGCNSMAISIAAPIDDEAPDRTADGVREVMRTAEKLEINVLIKPHEGLTEDPERMTDLLKRVGGFRCGTMPDFADAVKADDPERYLKRLTPYAACVCASMFEFGELDAPEMDDDKPGSLEMLAEAMMAVDAAPHATYDLLPLMRAVASVGFDGTLAIRYRGEGEGTLGMLQSRDAVDAAIEAIADA